MSPAQFETLLAARNQARADHEALCECLAEDPSYDGRCLAAYAKVEALDAEIEAELDAECAEELEP